MAKVHVKKGDTVYVLCGKDRAATGKVLRVLPATGRVVVEGVNMVSKKHKPRNQQERGGIREHAAPIDASNVMVICPKCNRPTKVNHEKNEAGKIVRVCKKCAYVFENDGAKPRY